jgi:rhodanese-related sulfurtransferase
METRHRNLTAQATNLGPMSEQETTSQPLTPQGVSELAGSEGVELIDVREPREFEAGHIAGSRNIPLNDLSSRAGEIDRAHKVVFYCRSGSRSGMATQAFSEAGYDAHNMEGGMLEWAEAKLPMDPADGTVAESLPPS